MESDQPSGTTDIAPAAAPDATRADLTATFVEIQALLTSTETFTGFLDDVCGLAKRSFAGEIACSITVVVDGRNVTVASSDDVATVADEGQYTEQAGPCLGALSGNIEVLIDDLTTETRFGDYPAKAAALGLRSVAAMPISDGSKAFGALNLYAGSPSAFDADSLVRPRALASVSAGALEVARRVTAQLTLNEDLKAAMAARRFIDQALGIIMAQQSCHADAAFDQLRRTSQNSHRKLREVALDLVTEVGGVRPESAPVFTTTPRP